MLAVIGLLYSVGLILAQRRTLQTAADAAALAGAWQVLAELQTNTQPDTKVFDQINLFVTDNAGSSPSSITALYVDGSGSSLGTVGPPGTPPGARGVSVTLTSNVQTILPGFVRVSQIALSNTATALLRPTAPPATAVLVVPVAVKLADFRAAYAAQVTYDLFNPSSPPTATTQNPTRAPTLNFLDAANSPSTGAPTSPALPLSTSLQYWSDGQHANGTLSTGGTVALAGSKYFDSIAAGLADNIRSQTPPAPGKTAAVVVPIWDTEATGTPPTADTVHIVGFAEIVVSPGQLSTTSAKGLFVPYSNSAGTTIVTIPPTPGDLGAVVVLISS